MKRISKLAIFLFIAIAMSVSVNAQVVIGSNSDPDGDALLDLKENGSDGSSKKGVLMPRVALVGTDDSSPLSDFVEGMIVYNTATTNRTDDPTANVIPGFYYSDGEEWKRIPFMYEGQWFYLPPAAIDVRTSGLQMIDLFRIYNDNLMDPVHANPGADIPTVIPVVYDPTDLDYYVLDYDRSVFDINSIDDEGKMYMTVSPENVSEQTFITIALKVK